MTTKTLSNSIAAMQGAAFTFGAHEGKGATARESLRAALEIIPHDDKAQVASAREAFMRGFVAGYYKARNGRKSDATLYALADAMLKKAGKDSKGKASARRTDAEETMYAHARQVWSRASRDAWPRRKPTPQAAGAAKRNTTKGAAKPSATPKLGADAQAAIAGTIVSPVDAADILAAFQRRVAALVKRNAKTLRTPEMTLALKAFQEIEAICAEFEANTKRASRAD